MTALEPGQQVGSYLIEAELGGGGMATVYRVRHAVLDTEHALKVLVPEYRVVAEARQRFLDEAKIQAKHLDHRGIVKVTDIVATNDVAGLVMELVEGPSLEQHIAALKSPPDSDQVRAIVLPILDALGHAHAHGIVHRDIKPANVLLARRGDRFEPKLTDFGIAKVSDRIGKKLTTRIAARMGTLGYMSPEQIRAAKQVTARSDIFSVGAMLYELVTLREAFPGDSEYDVMHAVVNANYRPIEQLAPKVEPAIAAAIRRCLDPDPDQRFAGCAELAAALRGTGTEVVGDPPPERPRRSPLAWLVPLGALLIAGGIGLTLYLTRSSAPAVSSELLARLDGARDAGAEQAEPGEMPTRRRPAKNRLVQPPGVGLAPTLGPDDALVTVIEFVDYTSGWVGRIEPVLQQVLNKYGGDVRLAIKYLSLYGVRSEKAANRALLAAEYGNFWSFHRALLADATATDLDGSLDRAWAQAGLNSFQALSLGDHARRSGILRSDAWTAKQASINLVPTLVINGEVVTGAMTADALDAIIARQLDEARALVAAGVSRDRVYEALRALPHP